MAPSIPLIILLLLLVPLSSSIYPPPPNSSVVGVTYYASNLNIRADGARIPKRLVELGIQRIRLLQPTDENVLLFAGTGIALSIGIQDRSRIESFAASTNSTIKWLASFLNTTDAAEGRLNITDLSVGYDYISSVTFDPLWDAIRNLRAGLQHPDFKLPHIPAVTTEFSFDLVTRAFPPSQAKFDVAKYPNLPKILEDIARNGVPFQIELYPYEVYENRSIKGCDIRYALFEIDPRSDAVMYDGDPSRNTTPKYWNMYEMMVDSVYASLKKMGHEDVKVEVTGTGWPGNDEPDASILNAGEHNGRLIALIARGKPTPMGNPMPFTYIHSLLNDNWNAFERPHKTTAGILTFELESKYDLDLTGRNVTAAIMGGAPIVGLSASSTLLLVFTGLPLFWFWW